MKDRKKEFINEMVKETIDEILSINPTLQVDDDFLKFIEKAALQAFDKIFPDGEQDLNNFLQDESEEWKRLT